METYLPVDRYICLYWYCYSDHHVNDSVYGLIYGVYSVYGVIQSVFLLYKQS